VYRIFRSRAELLGAAVNACRPHLHVAPEQGSLRQRLTAVLMAQAKSIAEAPAFLAASWWITLGVHIDQAVNIKRSGICVESALPRVVPNRQSYPSSLSSSSETWSYGAVFAPHLITKLGGWGPDVPNQPFLVSEQE
jgi:hypothetical protein